MGIQNPRFESKEKQIKFLLKNHLDTSNLFYFKSSYCDSMAFGKLDITPERNKIEKSFNLCQFRLFGRDGKLEGGWTADNDLKTMFALYPKDAIPGQYNNRMEGLNLGSDLQMYSTSDNKDVSAEKYLGKYEYVFIGYWATYLSKTNLKMLINLEKYIKAHPEHDIILLKVNTSGPLHHWRQSGHGWSYES